MIVAGVGFRRGCAADELVALVGQAAARAGVRVGALAAPAAKCAEPGLRDGAGRLGLAVLAIAPEDLAAAQPRCVTRSARALAATGAASIAEGCALAAVGAGGRLLLPRIASAAVTLCVGRGRGMTVHFIGAGPGAADLLTLRGRDLIAACPVCLYAGSIIPPEMLVHCPPDARKVDTAPLTLDAIEAEFVAAHAAGQDVARLQSGDLSIYSAVAEQIRRLERHGIPFTLTPGVPAFAAAAAALRCELTVPEVAQSLVLTRVSGRASAMPPGETLAAFGATGATLAIHLAVHALERIVRELVGSYGAACPVAVVARASWPDERIVRGTLGDIVARMDGAPITRTALVLVGPALAAEGFRDSALYDPDYRRRFRPGGPP